MLLVRQQTKAELDVFLAVNPMRASAMVATAGLARALRVSTRHSPAESPLSNTRGFIRSLLAVKRLFRLSLVRVAVLVRLTHSGLLDARQQVRDLTLMGRF